MLAMASVPAKPETSEMDAEDALWSELPEELVSKIQARLPLVSLVRSRTVCKGWNAAVASPWLLQERLEARGGERDCMVCVMGWIQGEGLACFVYDRASDRWYQVQLPPWLRDEAVKLPGTSTGSNVLLCSGYEDDWDMGSPIIRRLYMGSPVGLWSRLPDLPRGVHLRLDDVKGVFQDPEVGFFILVALQGADRPWWRRLTHPRPAKKVRTIVFESEIWSWSSCTKRRRALPGNQFVHPLSGRGAFVGTVLYCVAGRGNLLAFDLKRRSWSSLEVAKPHVLKILYCNVINVRGRLLCVALCSAGSRRLTSRSSVQIWELDFARMTWTEVAAMPDDMFHNHFRRICFPMGTEEFSRIMVVAGEDSEVCIMHTKLDKLLAVDLGRKPAVWRWLPPCPDKQFQGFSLFRLDPWLEYRNNTQDHMTNNMKYG